jgi:hypothetical protein
MLLRRKFFSSFSRAPGHLLRSRPGVRHATGTPPTPYAATTIEKLDAALNNMSHGLCMFVPNNRLLLRNDRYDDAQPRQPRRPTRGRPHRQCFVPAGAKQLLGFDP